jgi:hypothetical protein
MAVTWQRVGQRRASIHLVVSDGTILVRVTQSWVRMG